MTVDAGAGGDEHRTGNAFLAGGAGGAGGTVGTTVEAVTSVDVHLSSITDSA